VLKQIRKHYRIGSSTKNVIMAAILEAATPAAALPSVVCTQLQILKAISFDVAVTYTVIMQRQSHEEWVSFCHRGTRCMTATMGRGRNVAARSPPERASEWR
jgi:hypothetical protein